MTDDIIDALPAQPAMTPAAVAECERLARLVRESMPSCFVPATSTTVDPFESREAYEAEFGILVEPERWADGEAHSAGKVAA